MNTSTIPNIPTIDPVDAAVSALVASVREIGAPDDLVRELVATKLSDAATGETLAPETTAAIREAVKEWRAASERAAHPSLLDHRYDRPAREWKPTEHPASYCNLIDCTVHPHVAPDGRAIGNYGVHRTYTRIETTAYGDVFRVCVGQFEDVTGISERGAVYFQLTDQDVEDEDDHVVVECPLTADEADALADALRTRAAALRSVEAQEADEAAKRAIKKQFPDAAFAEIGEA